MYDECTGGCVDGSKKEIALKKKILISSFHGEPRRNPFSPSFSI